jgi:hypothetical protein
VAPFRDSRDEVLADGPGLTGDEILFTPSTCFAHAADSDHNENNSLNRQRNPLKIIVEIK